MCQACWEEEGSPKIVNDKTKHAALLIADADSFGHLHIIVDDWNLEDRHLQYCREEVIKNSKGETAAELLSELELLTLLGSMTFEERNRALYQFETGSDPVAFRPSNGLANQS